MPHWFLSTRVQTHGGSVGPVKAFFSDQPGKTSETDTSILPNLAAAVRGRDVFFVTHGFEVNQDDGISHLDWWLQNFDSTVPAAANAPVGIGVIWPGDAFIPILVDYVIEGNEAISSGDELSGFINQNFTGAVTLSFASHSLGARLILQLMRGLAPQFSVRRVLMMAGAIDSNCLINEYADVVNKIKPTAEISILASVEDDVLALAFPLGNPLQRIIDHMHPYFRAALGHRGPATPFPASPPMQSGWQIPKKLDYGHHDYLPGEQITDTYPLPVDIPPCNTPVPPDGTPPSIRTDPKKWKPAWSAAFASTRYRRP
jgi:hypothetical protein